MLKNFETIIGVEIHLELNTKSKLFSSAENNFAAPVNECVSSVDLAYPGTLPSLNKEAVIKAIKLAKALKMQIDFELHFDRKNYFYTDLPKGFQITQQYRPIGRHGLLNISNKSIRINRIHIEEDTARQIHKGEYTYLNYNRAGVALVEIVSEPDLRSADETIEYIQNIAQIAKILNISDAIMAKGSLRADINISTRIKGNKRFGTKVEIKNLNSYNNIKLAIEQERQTQIYCLINSIKIHQETKRFSESEQKVITMRGKGDVVDYKYFPEPNIPVIVLEKDFIDQIQIEELPEQIRARFEKANVSRQYISVIIDDSDLKSFIDKFSVPDLNEWVKIVFSEFYPLAKEKRVSVLDLDISEKLINELIEAYFKQDITRKQLKEIIPKMIFYKKDLKSLIGEFNLEVISDYNLIDKMVNDIIVEFANLKNDYLENKQRCIKFVFGQLMKKTNGKVDAKIANSIIINRLEENAL